MPGLGLRAYFENPFFWGTTCLPKAGAAESNLVLAAEAMNLWFRVYGLGFRGLRSRNENGKCIIWGFPKIRDTLLGVPIIRTIVFWGLY